MKFKGEPNLFVRINKPINGEVRQFSFDSNGIYETDNPITIKRLTASFEPITEENNAQTSVLIQENNNKICKHCGGRHEKAVYYAHCARKTKKE